MVVSDDEFGFGLGASRDSKRKRDDNQISRLKDFKDSLKFLGTLPNLDIEEADYEYLFILRDISVGRIKIGDPVDDNDNDEPEYAHFLDHIATLDADSYTHDETPAPEPRHSGREDSETRERGEVLKATDCQLRTKPSGTSNAAARKARLESRRIRKSMLDGKDSKTRTTLKGKERCSKTISVVDSEARAPVSFRSSGDKVFMESSPPPQPHLKKDHGMRFDDVDESYGWFISCLEKRHDVIVFKPNDHQELIYDKLEECSSDSDIMIMDDAPFLDGGFNPFVPSRDLLPYSVDEGMDGYRSAEQSHFRVNLMKCIEEPYDELEYRDLLDKMLEKKPIKHHRETRSGLVKGCIDPNKLGFSYFEHHKDFALKFESVHDKHKKLQLLRAFFFWLKNAGHNDNFRPWKDALFLKIVL